MLVQRTPEIQAIFTRARTEGWDAAKLALELGEPFQRELDVNDPQKAFQVAEYLADEYLQMGDTMLLISRHTGKAIGRITDDDVWVPAPVPREDGSMAQPLPRLRPELEAFLVHWHFEKDRERQITDELAPTLHPTDLVKEQGDARLLPVTRAGRTTLVSQLKDKLPSLLTSTGGSLGRFLSHFDIREDDPPKGSPYEPLLRCTAIGRTVTAIQDMKAMNLHFNRLGGLCAHTGNAWAREIARTLAIAAKEHFSPLPQSLSNFEPKDIKAAVWVGDPDTVDALVKLRGLFSYTSSTVVPVEHAPTIAVLGKAGVIVINPASYECQGRELFSRWEVAARLEYTLWVDWAQVRAYEFDDVAVTGTSVVAG
jgi:hypothetical protein